MDPFYVILEKNDPRCHRHDDWQSVSREAERLARANPDSEFIILTTVEVVGPARPPLPRHAVPPADLPQHLAREMDPEIPF